MKQYLINHPTRKGMHLNILEGPDIAEPAAIVLFAHGYKSHCQPYFRSADDLAEKATLFATRRVKTFGFEFSGHGLSDGSKYIVGDFQSLVDELHGVLVFITRAYYSVRIYIMGESMGASVAVHFMGRGPEHAALVAGLILQSPMCEIHEQLRPSLWALQALRTLGRVAPWIPYTVPGEVIDGSLYEEYRIARTGSPFHCSPDHRDTLGTLVELYEAGERTVTLARHIAVPTMVVYGEEEAVIETDSIHRFFSELSTPQALKTIKCLPRKGHQVLAPKSSIDQTGYAIIGDVADWVVTAALLPREQKD